MGKVVPEEIKNTAKTLYALRYTPQQIAKLLDLTPQTIRTYVNKEWEEKKSGHRMSSHYRLTWEEAYEAMAQFPTFNLKELAAYLRVSHSFMSKIFIEYGVRRKWDLTKVKEIICSKTNEQS